LFEKKETMDVIDQNSSMQKNEIKSLKHTIWRQLFLSLSVSLFLFLILFIYSSFKNDFGLFFISITLICVIIGATLFFIITRKYRLDLSNGRVIQEEEIVEDKIYKLDYEPGSRTFPINILSVLFVKKISQIEMREMHNYYIIVKGERIDIDENYFNTVEKGNPIIIRRAPNSGLFLGVEPL
jgi:Na+/melibiose symporter-like transporter